MPVVEVPSVHELPHGVPSILGRENALALHGLLVPVRNEDVSVVDPRPVQRRLAEFPLVARVGVECGPSGIGFACERQRPLAEADILLCDAAGPPHVRHDGGIF